jgi:uncharacterized membrane protein
MTRNQTDDVVKEYLSNVERLVSGLPAMQRRELLLDLETHIATERIERDAESQAEILAILERLGSPEVVAAAAHEESPVRAAPPAPARRVTPTAVVVGAALLALVAAATFVLFFLSVGSSGPIGESVPSNTDVTAVPGPTPTG